MEQVTQAVGAKAAVVVEVPELAGPARWIVEGWRAHIADAKHPNHVANSWAKHRGEFGPAERACEAAALERIVAFGVSIAAAVWLLDERRQAREAKAGAAS